MGYVFSFNQNKAWEQHAAEDGPSDLVGIANDCGIPKGFAVYAATAEFGVEPLLCTESHIRSVEHSDSHVQGADFTACYALHRSGERVLLGWPVILQAYVCHQSASAWMVKPIPWEE